MRDDPTPIVPHTATEDHGLWDLAGTYGQTPANPAGFAPGTTVERPFEAGTHHYYCRVHPQQMKGVVAVPVKLASARYRPLLPVAGCSRNVRACPSASVNVAFANDG